MPNNSFLFNQAPRWHQHDFGLQRQLTAELQSWLQETGSLTKRLRAIHGEDFAVSVLFQGWRRAFIDESRLLEQPASDYQLVREVMLHNNHQPLVLARTIMPQATIEIAQRKLSHLGSRPLGEVIFAYRDLELRQRQFSRIEPAIWAKQQQANNRIETATWGRRTVYAIHNQPLLVAEFFLPAALN